MSLLKTLTHVDLNISLLQNSKSEYILVVVGFFFGESLLFLVGILKDHSDKHENASLTVRQILTH